MTFWCNYIYPLWHHKEAAAPAEDTYAAKARLTESKSPAYQEKKQVPTKLWGRDTAEHQAHDNSTLFPHASHTSCHRTESKECCDLCHSSSSKPNPGVRGICNPLHSSPRTATPLLTKGLSTLGPGIQVPLELHITLRLYRVNNHLEGTVQLEVDLSHGGREHTITQGKNSGETEADRPFPPQSITWDLESRESNSKGKQLALSDAKPRW